MKNEDSIDRIIQINNIDIGQNISKLRKAMNLKQTVVFLYACCHILGCDMKMLFNFK